jgi:RNA polymerase sigma factor (sigma-70 family)
MCNDSSTADLVTRAISGDAQAWDALVERFAPLIWSVCRKYRLGGAESEDVGQNVWLKLVDHLDTVRDPAALPSWIITTTRRECYRVVRVTFKQVTNGQALAAMSAEWATTAEDELLLAERHAVLREAFARLPSSDQQLLALLIADPPVPYVEISARLGIAVGSVGPTRRRCLDRLRSDPAIASLIDAEATTGR